MLSSGQISKVLQTTSLLEEFKESLGLNSTEKNKIGEISWHQIGDLLYALIDERDLLLAEIASQESEINRLRGALHIHDKFQPKVAEGKDFEDVPLPLQY